MKTFLKILFTFSTLTLLLLSSNAQIVALGTKPAKKGGGNENPCFICLRESINDIEIRFFPNQFPFKIDRVEYSNASSTGMNIYYGSSVVYPNGGDMYFTKDKLFYTVNNQTINYNSPFINDDGSITLSVPIISKYCINGTIYNQGGQFKHSVTLYLNEVHSTSGNIINSYNYTGIALTDYLYNCNNTLPYELGLSSFSQEVKSVELFQFFPNPINEVLNISLPNSSRSNFSIAIINPINGELYKKINFVTTEFKNEILKIDVSDIPRGIVILDIKTTTSRVVKRLLIE